MHLPTPRVSTARRLLQAADQVTLAGLVAACFLAILAHGGCLVLFRHQRIDFDRAPPLELQFQIDVNTADWSEFTLLPGIGETLARRVVKHRAQHGPFRSVEQLEEVPGIGPKTMRRIRRFVKVD